MDGLTKNQAINIVKQAHNFDTEKVSNAISLVKTNDWLTNSEIDELLKQSDQKSDFDKNYKKALKLKNEATLDRINKSKNVVHIILIIAAIFALVIGITAKSIVYLAIGFGFISTTYKSSRKYLSNIFNKKNSGFHDKMK